MSVPQFLIAAPHSGSGKTLFTLALLRYLQRKGVAVQPYKCGPDYLDTKLHEVAAKTLSFNLDLFMSDEDSVKSRYAGLLAKADASVVEGVMGLFDGYDCSKGSSAHVAKVLDIPVVMVINAKAMAHSVAALLKGFCTYDPDVRIAGVVFNFVSSESHYRFLKDAALEVGVEPLGWIEPNADIRVESRHLGLKTENSEELNRICDAASTTLLKHIDMDRLLAVTLCPKPANVVVKHAASGKRRIAVAKDEAFSFIYPANVQALEEHGVVQYFSPIHDTHLPEVDFIYLPGGYPELYAKELSQNRIMLDAVRRYSENGGLMLAECGGMIYLGKSLTLNDGAVFPMASVFNFDSTMQDARCTLGYREVALGQHTIRGHEFHYSRLAGTLPPSIAAVKGAVGNPCSTGIYSVNRTVASYFHAYWADLDVPITDIIESALK